MKAALYAELRKAKAQLMDELPDVARLIGFQGNSGEAYEDRKKKVCLTGVGGEGCIGA
jgi:hypothetical protein